MRYAARRVAQVGGGTVGFYGPAESGAAEAIARFAANAPPPPHAEILELHDVILGGGRDWACLYDRDGLRIDAAALVRYDEALAPHFWRAAPTLPNVKSTLTIAEPVVYGSIFFNHWGHFLLESAARLWAKPERRELGGLSVIHAWRPASALPAIEDYLAGASVGAAPAGRIRLAKCFLPTPTFVYRGYADPRHLLVPHEIARRVLNTAAGDDRPVYFSRGQVHGSAAGRLRVRNEAELEARLSERGALVIHMQKLTLADQIALMNAHRTFIGLWGSALHNTLFSLHAPQLSVFTLVEDGHCPADFLLVDSLVRASAHYLYTVHDPVEGVWEIDVEATLAYLDDCGAV